MVASDVAERQRELRGLPLAFAQTGKQPFDALEEHAHFRHVAVQEITEEGEFRRRR